VSVHPATCSTARPATRALTRVTTFSAACVSLCDYERPPVTVYGEFLAGDVLGISLEILATAHA
jgi:hypothetical protein